MSTPVTSIRAAIRSDVLAIEECVQLAYQSYVRLLGIKPNPMLDNYHELIQTSSVWVLVLAGSLIGVLVLEITDEGFLLNNIAVLPNYQKYGYGTQLIRFAEHQALQAGFTSIYLYTNIKMVENQALYASHGFTEYARRDVNGRQGVFMKKALIVSP
jgi:N-acetylglutamate synthase-like GNAT family acetyltransferase